MIYNVHGFQQDKVCELGLDNNDALVLRAIKNFYSSATIEYEIIDGDKFVWIKQDYLAAQIPSAGNKNTIMRRVNKMIDKGILESKTLYSKKGKKGTYYYIKMTKKADWLADISVPKANAKIENGQVEGMPESKNTGTSKSKNTGMRKTGTKDTQETRDTQERKDTTTTIGGEEELKKINATLIMKEWNKLDDPIPKIVTLNSGTKRYKSLKSRVEEFGEDNVLRAIDNVSRSNFLKGNNNSKWTIDFDWFIRPNNFIKVLEGNYENKEAVARTEQPFGLTEKAQSNIQRMREKYKDAY